MPAMHEWHKGSFLLHIECPDTFRSADFMTGHREVVDGQVLDLNRQLADGLHTVGEVEEHFAQACFEADRRLGEPAACRWFLNWFDDAPRAEMRRELLVEVELELRNREASTEFEFDFDSASERLPVNRLRDYPWPVEEPDDANVEIEAIREAVLN